MKPISHSLRDMLVRQGIANGRAGTRKLARKIARTAGTGAARMGADDQGEEPSRPLTGLREGSRNPMGMGKRTPAETGASQQGGQHQSGRNHSAKSRTILNVGEPSSSRETARPVLRLLQGGSSKRSATTNVTLRLVL